MNSDTLQRFEAVVRKSFDNAQLKLGLNSTASDVDGWDSLTHLQLMISVEKEFGIALPIETTFEMRTVGDLVVLVDKLRGKS